jgi:hypothetical protein
LICGKGDAAGIARYAYGWYVVVGGGGDDV